MEVRRWSDVYMTFFLNVVITFGLIHTARGSCNEKQAESCRNAANADKLGSFSAGGTCLERQYVTYTHTCTVNTYLGPTATDFCCCLYEESVMCCRYHQQGGLFRCSLAENTVAKIASSNEVSWRVLVPAICVPLLTIACCVFCVVKCCCYKYGADDNMYCDIPCISRKPRGKSLEDGEKSNGIAHQCSTEEERRGIIRDPSSTSCTGIPLVPTHRTNSGCGTHGHQRPSAATQMSTDSATSQTPLLRLSSIDERGRVGFEPSAPPPEDPDAPGESEDYPESAFSNFHHPEKGSHVAYSYANSSQQPSATSLCSGCAQQNAVFIGRQSSNMSENGAACVSEDHARGTLRSESVCSGLAYSGVATGGVVGCPGCAGALHSYPPPSYDDHHKDPVI